MNTEKQVQFLRHFILLLLEAQAASPARWGKMTFQQMVEHLADAVRMASGKKVYTEVITPENQLDKFREFLMSDKPFRENTVNPLMPAAPAPVRNVSAREAIKELQVELNDFFAALSTDEQKTTRNPIFGDLNFEQNVQLLYKHVRHHLQQFEIEVEKEIEL